MAITNNLKISRTGVYLLSLLVLTIVIVPLAAAALTLTADKTEYVPGDALVVSGTATPDSAVAIQVYNPAGARVAFGQGSTDGDGAFSVSVLVWPATATVSMPYGTYRISASDAGNGDVTEITVEFVESVTTPPAGNETEVSTTTITITVTRTTTTTSTTTETSTTTSTTTSRITTTRTSTTTNTVTSTTTLPRVTTTTTAVTTTTATSSVTMTSTAQAVTQTVTSEVTETEEVGFSGTVTYAAVAVAVIAIIGAAVLTMRQRA